MVQTAVMAFSVSGYICLCVIFSAIVIENTGGFLFPTEPTITPDVRDRCPPRSYQQGKVKIFRDKCYNFIMDTEKYWDDARYDCVHKGATMVIINDAATQEFIYSSLKSYNYGHKGIWIGLTDKHRELHWVWASGEPLQHYANWGSHQGSGAFHGLYDCVYMRFTDDGKWHDAYCHTWNVKYSYICQFDAYPTTTTSTTSTTPQSTQMSTTTTATTTDFTTVTDGTSTQSPSTEPTTNTQVDTTMSTPGTSYETPHTNIVPHAVSTRSQTTDATTVTDPSTTATETATMSTTVPTMVDMKTSTAKPTTVVMKTSTTVPTTVVMETSIPTTVVMKTTIPTTTTETPTVTKAPSSSSSTTTTTKMTTAGNVCDNSPCQLDCGFYGYKVDGYGCQLCECNI